MLNLIKRDNLFFKANNLVDVRSEESFEEKSCSAELQEISESLYNKTVNFLPTELRPKNLCIALESTAKIELDNGKIKEENVPLSLVLSLQIPYKSEIRMGMLEIENDVKAYESVLAHEFGHLVIEWPARIAGLVKSSDPVFPYWPNSVYEGVADFYSVIMTGRKVIGSKDFYRTIDDFESFDLARSTSEGSIDLCIKSLQNMGLDKKYASYSQFINLLNQFWSHKGEDPYAVGTVVARNLYELSQDIGSDKVMEKIISLAMTGKKIRQPEEFLSEISNR